MTSRLHSKSSICIAWLISLNFIINYKYLHKSIGSNIVAHLARRARLWFWHYLDVKLERRRWVWIKKVENGKSHAKNGERFSEIQKRDTEESEVVFYPLLQKAQTVLARDFLVRLWCVGNSRCAQEHDISAFPIIKLECRTFFFTALQASHISPFTLFSQLFNVDDSALWNSSFLKFSLKNSLYSISRKSSRICMWWWSSLEQIWFVGQDKQRWLRLRWRKRCKSVQETVKVSWNFIMTSSNIGNQSKLTLQPQAHFVKLNLCRRRIPQLLHRINILGIDLLVLGDQERLWFW